MSVTVDGVLVVTASNAAVTLDVRQAVLMGTQVAREALRVDPKGLTSALFQAI